MAEVSDIFTEPVRICNGLNRFHCIYPSIRQVRFCRNLILISQRVVGGKIMNANYSLLKKCFAQGDEKLV